MKDIKTLNSHGDFALGMMSCGACMFTTQPLAAVKTLSMEGMSLKQISRNAAGDFRYLYRGLLPNLTSGALSEGVVFAVQGLATRWFAGAHQDSIYGEIAVASVAGVAGSPINASCERVMIQQQIHGGYAHSALSSLASREGIRRALFKGLMATGMRDAIFNIGVFPVSNLIERSISQRTETHQAFLSGFLSGAIMGCLSTPFDLIKTRIQSDREEKIVKITTTAKEIIREQNIRGLWRGGAWRAMYIGTMMGLIVVAKERFQPLLPESCFH